MIYQALKPSPHLSKYIRDYLLMHFRFDGTNKMPVKPYPACPKQGLIFSIKGEVVSKDSLNKSSEKRANAVIFGQPIGRQDLYFSNEVVLLSVRFHPGTLYEFLGIPMTEFVQKTVDAELVLGKAVREVCGRLADASGYAEMIRVIETFLWQRIRSLSELEHPINEVTRNILNDPAEFSLEKLSKQACLSPSQFERRFIQQVGIRPKLFARICRFYSAFVMKQKNPLKSWQDTSWESGYSDYQHLVKDFKEFSGCTPKALACEDEHSPEQILGLNPGYNYF